MRKIFFILIIFVFATNSVIAEENDKLANLSKEDIEIIQNLEILEELEMLKDMELIEDYAQIKDIEILESEGENNEENND